MKLSLLREVPKEQQSLAFRAGEKLDNFLAVFAPIRAVRRKAARRFGHYMFSKHRGADKTRTRKDWVPGGGSADSDLLGELPTLRERSRDLNRNDGHAAGATGTMVTNVVGTGLKPQSRLDHKRLGITEQKARDTERLMERAFGDWMSEADSGDRMDFYEMQALAERQILENGEVLALPVMFKAPGRRFMRAVEMIEADRLATPTDKRSNKTIKDGVELGERGQPVGYYVSKGHPGAGGMYRTKSVDNFNYYAARDDFGRRAIMHLYYVMRPGQTRGLPFFAPAMSLFKDLADYMEAEVVAARVAACFSLFVKTQDPYQAAVARKDDTVAGQRIEELEPGLIEYLAPGEDISSFNPQRPGMTFQPFVETVLRTICAAVGLPYELVSKDFSKVNYSSARAALLEARKMFRTRQGWLAERFCQPMWDMVLEEAYLLNLLGDIPFYRNRHEWARARWIPDGWRYINPLQEAKAAHESVDAQFSTRADECAARGADWEEVMEQIAREKAKAEELGIAIVPVRKPVPA